MNPAVEFFAGLDDNIKVKFFRSFDKVKLGFKADFKKMSGSDDIWEFWADGNNKFYRLFAFWDGRGKTKTLIICTHGIEKEKNKTPAKEIDKAEALKKEYFKAS